MIEDEVSIGELLVIHLSDLDCDVIHFTDGLEGFEYALDNPFDLLVLDINLPGMNGMEICRRLREESVNAPILMLTASTGENEKVFGLESGADDYITKPFSIKEFIARVKAIFRRVDIDKGQTELSHIRYREMIIDNHKRRVSVSGKPIDLTPREFDLLHTLASNPGVTFSRTELLQRVWTSDYEGYEHTVNSHVNRLRNKIEKDPDKPVYVLTSWGIGYRFNDEE